MRKSTVWTIVIIVVLIAAGIYLLNLPKEAPVTEKKVSEEKIPAEKVPEEVVEEEFECVNNEIAECTTMDNQRGFKVCLDGYWPEICSITTGDCEPKEDSLYNVCCPKAGKLVYCDEKKNFKPGELVIINVNLGKAMEKAGLDFDPYQICDFNKLEGLGEFYLPNAYCSGSLKLEHFHHVIDAGLVPVSIGKVTLVEIRVYPAEVDLSTLEKAEENINQSKIIFTYEINVIE